MESDAGTTTGTPQAAASKRLLLKASTETGLNLYDHLSHLLMKVMDEQPTNAVDVMEEMSLDLKRVSLEGSRTSLHNLPETSGAEFLAEQQRHLFSQPEEPDPDQEMLEAALPNLSEVGFYLEQAGVGLGREEMQRIFLALKHLVESEALQGCRLWGKILGVHSNYIVAETEKKDGGEELSPQEGGGRAETEEEEVQETDPLPRSSYQPPPVVPAEASGTGANKHVYYVCSQPGLPWVRLPPVTPAQIVVARQIRKFFTGKLDAPVTSYPPFPGNEANYLRAQVARISAGTQVSPSGFYLVTQEEGEEEGEEVPQDSCELNPDFEGLPAREMAESLSNWVHHTQHILQQGRCTWVNLAEKPNEDSYEEAEPDGPEEEPSEPEPEVGPPLLTPLSQDAETLDPPPWTARLSSTLTPQHAVAVLRSNIWPGAYAYACGRKFENIYIGWGLKYPGGGYSPPVPPPPQGEYPTGPEITEALDPSVEEERQMKEALERRAAQEEGEEGEEEEEEEEEEDDD